MRPVYLAAAALVMVATPALADPAEFLTKAMKGDNSETTLGHMAERQGASAATKRFGAMLAADHTKARAQALPVARRHGVSPTTAMADEAVTEQHKLEGLHGAAFDREFARYMVSDHEKDIADFEKEANSKDPADIRALARQTLPALRRHLATAKSIRA
ncbi:MAG: DUF4142 domain-containing protein [Sphingomonadaceae bacterium]|nr:DUF4142 domain-containing protein [Sphingomonadaceae bacterium]